ncbi:MAG TPA: hypothetical protein VLG68_04780, partial [Gammaproteobacteria bacterium]|nr:hypothetical protein [Gammaproteobacteria bacterium]
QFPAMLITAAFLMIYRKEHRLSDAATSTFISVRMKCGLAQSVVVRESNFTAPFRMRPLPLNGTPGRGFHIIVAVFPTAWETN